MKYFFYLFIIILNLTSCNLNKKKTNDWAKIECYRDWNEIENEGVLTILAENSPASFFIYKGKNMGYEYELLHEFAKDMNIELKIIMMHNLDSMFVALKQCKGDLIACNLTITPEREQEILFTKPHYSTHQVLIQKKPHNWRKLSKQALKDSLITNIERLKGKEIFVWQNSTYFKQIYEINKKLNLNMLIIPVEGDITSEELIEMVDKDEIKYTITDENVAKINQNYFPDIDISLRVSGEQHIAFAGRKTSTQLIDTLSFWINDKKNQSTIGEVKRKYFKRKNLIKKAVSNLSSITQGQLSPYDSIIKKESQRIGWDWRLISAIIYQESKFETWKQSWAGAYGLFQFMPATAKSYGISPQSSADAQIKAGITKLGKNYKRWLRDLRNDSTEAIYFTLATFNAGRGHVDDARALAKKYGKNHNKWFGNVDEMMLNLSNPKYYRDKMVKLGYMRGKETYNYVKEIMKRFEEYKHAFPDQKTEK